MLKIFIPTLPALRGPPTAVSVISHFDSQNSQLGALLLSETEEVATAIPYLRVAASVTNGTTLKQASCKQKSKISNESAPSDDHRIQTHCSQRLRHLSTLTEALADLGRYEEALRELPQLLAAAEETSLEYERIVATNMQTRVLSGLGRDQVGFQTVSILCSMLANADAPDVRAFPPARRPLTSSWPSATTTRSTDTGGT